MTYDEVQAKMRAAISNADTMESEVEKVLADIKTDYENAANLNTQLEEQKARILDLQDTKQKLYLQIAGQEEKDEPEPLTGEAVINSLIEDAIKIDEEA